MTALEMLKAIQGIADVAREIATDMPDDCCSDAVATSLEALLDVLTNSDGWDDSY